MAGARAAALLLLLAVIANGVRADLVIADAERKVRRSQRQRHSCCNIRACRAPTCAPGLPQIDASGFRVSHANTLKLRNDGTAKAKSVVLCERSSLMEHAALYEV